MAFLEKTWTLGWAIDISNKNIIEHKGIPIFIGPILDTKNFRMTCLEIKKVVRMCFLYFNNGDQFN